MASLFVVTVVFGSFGCNSVLKAALGVDEIEPDRLHLAIQTSRPPLILDVRKSKRFTEGHISGAVSLGQDGIDGYLVRRGPPRDRAVVTVCNFGRSSLAAAAIVRGHGYDVASLKGGMLTWNELGLPIETGEAEPLDPALLAPPVLRATEFEQWMIVTAGFLVKSLYMLLSLLLILWLWRHGASDLKLMRYGLVSFLTGETLCAVHYLSGEAGNDAMEIGHQLGMVGATALIPWGLFRMLDHRVLRFSDPSATCAGLRFCGQCWKRKEVSCGLHRIMLFAAPVLAFLALMPLCVGIRPISVMIPVLGTDVHYALTTIIQAAEFRVYPPLASLFLLVTFALLWRGQKSISAAQMPFFIGFGFLCFALFRFFLLESYRSQPIWADVWEETTELAAIVAVGLLLVVFRRQLGLVRDKEPTPEGEG